MRKCFFCLFAGLMATAFCVVLSSCNKDDDNSSGGSGDSSATTTSIVGIWYKAMSEGEYVGCRFDANGKAYFETWESAPTWKMEPATWTVSGNTITVKAPSGIVAFTANFVISSDGKKLTFSNPQTPEQWKIFRSLAGSELTKM